MRGIYMLILIHLSLISVYGDDLALDINKVFSSDKIVVTHTAMPHCGIEYKFTPLKRRDRISDIVDGETTIPMGIKHTRSVTFYKRDMERLLKLRNPKYGFFNRKTKKFIYAKPVGKNCWSNIPEADFNYLLLIMTKNTVVWDISKKNKYIKENRTTGSKRRYVPILDDIFVIEINFKGKHLWPNDKERGNLFLSAIWEKKGKVKRLKIIHRDKNNKSYCAHYKYFKKEWSRVNSSKKKQ